MGQCGRYEEAQWWCEPDIERGGAEGVERSNGGVNWIGKGAVWKM